VQEPSFRSGEAVYLDQSRETVRLLFSLSLGDVFESDSSSSRPNSLFGQPGSLYDFENFNLGVSRERCAELEEQQKGMKKKINPKVINMIDK